MIRQLHSYLFLSIFSHILFIVLITFGIKNSANDFKNLTYVSLVYEFSNIKSNVGQQYQDLSKKKSESLKPADKVEKTSKADERILEERLHALMARKRILEKAQSGHLEFSNKGDIREISNSYLSLISEIIRERWIIPEAIPKNLEATVSIRILPNGIVFIENFEKKSGNLLFDSSVVRAIQNSSPLPPPKREILIGLRFRP